MNIKEFLRCATHILRDADIEAPVLEAGVMLCHVLNCDRTYLYSHDDRVLGSDEIETLRQMLEHRVKNVPLQYIIGYTEFMSLTFMVSPAVLIPRQDTELLVEKCIEIMSISKKNQQAVERSIADTDRCKVNVLDMCTGSGCIAISIAHYCPECRVVACDVSREALNIARVNSEHNGTQDRLELYQGDLFGALDNCMNNQKFDVIVSNPPYIETETILGLQKEVKDYEPSLALDGGQDGLVFYRGIIEKASEYLNAGGYLAFEIGYNQGESVRNLMQLSFKDIEIYKDLGGNDRVVIGSVKSENESLKK